MQLPGARHVPRLRALTFRVQDYNTGGGHGQRPARHDGRWGGSVAPAGRIHARVQRRASGAHRPARGVFFRFFDFARFVVLRVIYRVAGDRTLWRQVDEVGRQFRRAGRNGRDMRTRRPTTGLSGKSGIDAGQEWAQDVHARTMQRTSPRLVSPARKFQRPARMLPRSVPGRGHRVADLSSATFRAGLRAPGCRPAQPHLSCRVAGTGLPTPLVSPGAGRPFGRPAPPPLPRSVGNPMPASAPPPCGARSGLALRPQVHQANA